MNNEKRKVKLSICGGLFPFSIKKRKEDVKRYKEHADNKQIIKLVYVHERYVGKCMCEPPIV